MITDIFFAQHYKRSETSSYDEHTQIFHFLSQFARAASTYGEVGELYREFLSIVHTLVSCEQAVLYQYQENTSLLSPVAYWSSTTTVVKVSPSHNEPATAVAAGEAVFPADLLVSVPLDDTLSLAASAALHRHTFLYCCIPSDQQQPVSELTIPLTTHHHLSGVLLLRRSPAFSGKDGRILRDVCAIAAMSWYAITCKELLSEGEKERTEVHQRQTKFLSLLTHELRSPLNSIHGYLDLALMGAGGDLNAQQHEFVQRARIASQHLYALLEDLLCVARADAGQLRLHRTIVHLPTIIDSAIEELELVATDYEIALQADIEPHLPDIYADASRLQQILRNLIKNALQFTPKGGTVKITASIEKVSLATSPGASDTDEDIPTMACLRVSDTGIGIATEFHQRIFERFYRVLNRDADRSGGQGLGLSIVKQLVELHGGTITVESVPAQGSTFTCLIPGLLS